MARLAQSVSMGRLAIAVALSCAACGGPSQGPIGVGPRPVSSADPCAGLSAGPAADEPAEPRIALSLLSDEARAGAPIVTRPLDLGRLPIPPFGPITLVSRAAVPRPWIDFGRASLWREAVIERLPPALARPYRGVLDARVRASDAFQASKPEERRAACVAARVAALHAATSALAAALAQREEPICLLLRAEVLLEEGSKLEDEHLADRALESAAALAARARDLSPREDLVGYFARARVAEIETARGHMDEARREAQSLVGVAPPDPSLLGDAELRAAELATDGAERRKLLGAAIAAAPVASVVRLVAESRLFEEAEGAGELESAYAALDRIARMPALPGGVSPGEIAAEGYTLLLPITPSWWERQTPAIGLSGFVRAAEALAEQSEARGDLDLARRLRQRALAANGTGPEADRVRRALAGMPAVPEQGGEAARARVAKLVTDCRAGSGPLDGSLLVAYDGKAARLTGSLSGNGAPEMRACLIEWGPTYLRGVPPLGIEVVVTKDR